MSTITWIVIAVVVLAIIVLAIVWAMSRRPRLRALPEGARERYAEAWRNIEARFVDQPQQAVSDADGLALAAFRERGGREEDLPHDIREARELARGQNRDGDSMTENLRRAMQHYRSVMEDMLGRDPREGAGRREVAS